MVAAVDHNRRPSTMREEGMTVVAAVDVVAVGAFLWVPVVLEAGDEVVAEVIDQKAQPHQGRRS